MLFLLSPSKTLDYDSALPDFVLPTQPVFLLQVKALTAILKTKSTADLQRLMGISPKLAQLNKERYQQFTSKPTRKNARPALFSFKGDVYAPMQLTAWDKRDMAFAQENMRILSGLYGLLRPLDCIQAYRLEMGTKLKNKVGPDLYSFWRQHVSSRLNNELSNKKQKLIINLASEEYAKVIDHTAIKGQIVDVTFQDYHKGNYKIIALYAKQARGLMGEYIVKHRVRTLAELTQFAREGYSWAGKSVGNGLVFRRHK